MYDNIHGCRKTFEQSAIVFRERGVENNLSTGTRQGVSGVEAGSADDGARARRLHDSIQTEGSKQQDA
jgi:hypothetical protein